MRSAILAVMLALFACSAAAQEEKWYVGAAQGKSKVDLDEGKMEALLRQSGFGNMGFQADDTDDAFKFFGGYRFNRYVALEISYLLLGEVSSRTTATGIGPDRDATFTFKWKNGYSIAALGTLPLGERFAFMGRLGTYYANITSTRQLPADATSDRDTGLTLGVGLSFEFLKNFGIRAEYERFFDVGTDKTLEGDIDFISAGVVVRF